MIKTKCPICSGSKFSYVDSLGKSKIYACSKCGVMFQYPLPSRLILKKYYKELYEGKNMLRSTEKAYEEYNSKQELGRIYEIEKFKKGGKLLDIGASSGFFLMTLRNRKNWKAKGVEISASAVKEAKKNKVDVLPGDIFNKKIKNSTFDVITMHSVLEHIENPNIHIQTIYKKLKTGGILVVSVPNIRSFEYYLYKLLRKRFAGFIFEHVFYYTPKSITILLKNNNFKIKKITSRHFSALSLPPKRPFIGWFSFFPKLLFEYTDIGGKLLIGNIVYVYAEKN